MRISVALCTFNGAAYLPRQLRSLLAQERLPDEVVAFDDRSTDGTPSLLRDFAAAAPFPVKWRVNEENLGTPANFQSAFAAAAGDIIAPCDQDDVWYPEKLARFEAVLSSPERPDLVFSDADLVDERLRPLGRRMWESIGFGGRARAVADDGRLWSVLARFNVVTGAAMAFRADRRGLVLPVPCGWVHDGWIALLLSAAGRCRAISEPLLAYRQHPAQQIGGGPATLAARVARARRMDAAYFRRLADNFDAAVDRLDKAGVSGPAVDRLVEKVAHCRARAEMREGGRRTAGVAAELFAGRYWTCALGWRSAAQDLWLARNASGQIPL